jgi:Tol biopolymer transport system component
LIAAFLSLSLLVAGTRVLQAEPTAGESGASTATLSDPPDPSSPSDNGAVVQDDELRQSARHMYRVFIANEPDHRPVCIMNSNGSGLRPIVDMGKGRYAGSPRMSPDSKYIAFDVWAPATDVRAASAKVYVVGVDGGQLTDLGIGSMPTWVPNSQQLTFFRHGRGFGLWVINRDGTLAARLNENGNSPRWSPDGKQIAFVRLGANGGVAVLDPKSGHERLVTPSRLPTGDVLDYRHGLDWSPDGTRLCVQCAQTPENMEIRLIDVQTGAITVRLNEQTGHSLSWSPKATKILFWMKGPEDQFNQLYVLSPDTKDPPERVAGQPRYRDNTDASWSADGTRIVFTSGMPSIENK